MTIAAATCAANVAHAAEPPTIELEYAAPPSCPPRAQLLDELRARSPQLVEAQGTAPASRFRVTIQAAESGVEASIEMTRRDGAFSHRVLHADTCAEAVAAAAVIVAMILPSTEPEEPSTNSSARPRTRPSAEAAPPEEAPTPEARSAPRVTRWTPLDLRRRTEFQLAAGGQVGFAATMLGATVGGGGFGEVTFLPKEWLAPSFRLAFLAQGAEFTTSRGTALVKLRTARLSACPARLPARTRLFLRVCVAGELGRLRGQGQDVDEEGQSRFLWSALGASARAVWNLPVIALEIEGAALFPLVRDAFVFEPPPVERAFAVPAVEASALIGLSAHWP